MKTRKYKFNDGGRSNHFPSKLKKDRTGDCTIRAIAIATKLDYKKVMSDMFTLGLEIGCMPNDDKVVESYFKERGYVKRKTLKNGKRKYIVNDFPKSNVILRVAKHIVFVSDEYVEDVWDCSRKSVGVWYEKESN